MATFGVHVPLSGISETPTVSFPEVSIWVILIGSDVTSSTECSLSENLLRCSLPTVICVTRYRPHVRFTCRQLAWCCPKETGMSSLPQSDLVWPAGVIERGPPRGNSHLDDHLQPPKSCSKPIRMTTYYTSRPQAWD